MIDSRLRRRIRVLEIDDINEYCEFLFDESSAAAETEIVHFIDAITTNKTDFFREKAHFDFMRSRILPHLAEAGRHTIRIWSAACSIGAEPYTIAMELESFCQNVNDLSYSILSSDISTAVLAKAVVGRYPVSMIDPIPDECRRRYIMVSRDPRGGEFRIVPQLRTKVSFFQLNLMDNSYPFGCEFDMIFCRNTLIYFDRKTQANVLQHLCTHLRHGGYLFLGHSESITGVNLPVNTIANSIFKRR
jgi:chemotaxis protein methyltransferase CheR